MGRVLSLHVDAIVRASSSALSAHFQKVFASNTQDFNSSFWISRALEGGYNFDLDDAPGGSSASPSGFFDHGTTTRIFYGFLRPLFRQTAQERRESYFKVRTTRGTNRDRHIWGADESRRLFSLFPTGRAFRQDLDTESSDTQGTIRRRSRVSSIVQNSLRTSREVLKVDKTLTGEAERIASTFVPSPFFVAKQILVDPDALATEVYARAAMRIYIQQKIEDAVGRPLDLSFSRMTESFAAIQDRSFDSKDIGADYIRFGPEIVFMCHYLALIGLMSVRLEWSEESPAGRPDIFLSDPDAFFINDGSARRVLGARFVKFRVNPDVASLPKPGELLNEICGLPLPIEGGQHLFYGGLRFAQAGNLVTALSGTFGVGKTSACLSLAAALAPLGCRTLFLSCEEEPEDIMERLREAAPEHVARTTPLFRAADLGDGGSDPPWFQAYRLRIDTTDDEPGVTPVIDVAAALAAELENAVEYAGLFEPYDFAKGDLPPFSRPIIVVDGLHQLFQETRDGGALLERSLRRLVDSCRALKAIFIFTIAADVLEGRRLDYLCDLVIDLLRVGYDTPDSKPATIFQLLKARRQPIRAGAHIFHLSSPKGLRIKPNAAAHADASKNIEWGFPDSSALINLIDDPKAKNAAIFNKSQLLIYGRGSSGKAALGLYILHRRPQEEFDHFEFSSNTRSRATYKLYELSGLPVPTTRPYFESRVLVVSFLYQKEYYRSIMQKLSLRSRRNRPSVGRIQNKRVYDSDSRPDSSYIDVLSLYPGALGVEDFISKIENRIIEAEYRGLPFTGVLIDGIHNVFIQFPGLERDTTFWPQLYNLLRRRSLTVVSTHTDFELKAGAGGRNRSMIVDFEYAQRKSAPLLSALVSASDYVLDLSAEVDAAGDGLRKYKMRIITSLANVPMGADFVWDREACRLYEAGQLTFDLDT